MDIQPTGSCTALSLRRDIASDIVEHLGSKLTPGGREEAIRYRVLAYGEPHGSGLRKRTCPVMTRQAIAHITGQGGSTPRGQDVTVEHLVPRKVVRDILLSLPQEQRTIDKVEGILDRLTLTALITKEQDVLLRDLKLTSKMPAGWCPWTGDPLERYRIAGLLGDLVVIAPLEAELTPPMAALLAGFPRHPDLVVTGG